MYKYGGNLAQGQAGGVGDVSVWKKLFFGWRVLHAVVSCKGVKGKINFTGYQTPPVRRPSSKGNLAAAGSLE
jgi:hypothetical protein